MPTTLKLSDELKRRIAAVVEGTGQSAHAFMLQAIERQTRAAEKRRTFVQGALEAREETYRTGLAYDAKDVHSYVKSKLAGKRAVRPKARSWRK
jgi:predicted transcriptional regulator